MFCRPSLHWWCLDSVFDLSGELGKFNPPLVDDDPPHWWLQSLVWGVGIDPLRKVQDPNSSLNRYKLMSDIIQTHHQKLFVIVCRLTATPVLLLCLITFKQSFNESVLFSLLNVMRLHYCKVPTIYIYSVIADVRLQLWQRIHSYCIQSTGLW